MSRPVFHSAYTQTFSAAQLRALADLPLPYGPHRVQISREMHEAPENTRITVSYQRPEGVIVTALIEPDGKTTHLDP